jgi:hypothetical protein
MRGVTEPAAASTGPAPWWPRIRPRAVATVLAAAAVVVCVWTVPGPAMPRGAAGVRASPHEGGACEFDTLHVVAPVTVPVGAQVTITTGLRARCDTSARRLNVVLLVDAGAHMHDGARDWVPVLVGDLDAALRAVDLPGRDAVRIGIVSFSEALAQTETYLTADLGDLRSALHNIVLRTGEMPLGGLGEGVRKARRVLQFGRESESGSAPNEVIVLASRGFTPAECDAVRTSTSEVDAAGIVLVTACGGGLCDQRCLSAVASRPAFAFGSQTWAYLAVVLADLVRGRGSFHPISDVMLTDDLGDGMVYAGGGDPGSGVGNRLGWTFSPWPEVGVTRTYSARAVEVGRVRVSTEAKAVVHYQSFLSSVLSETVSLPEAWLDVVPPTATPSPSPSAVPATPTGTPTPPDVITASPTPSVTATGVPHPTPGHGSLYLPLAAARGCTPWEGAVDLILVIDVSGSMGTADIGGADGLTRWDAARAVARDLVAGALRRDDRVAVVAFAGSATVTARLGGRQAAQAALDDLPRWDGSRMDVALDVAGEELAAGARDRPGTAGTVLLLTDADLNQADVASLLAAADRVRAGGARILAVGFGAAVDTALLAAVTGSGGRVRDTGSTPHALLAASLAPDVRCRR